ncbi:MAG TPA: hypothetical protein VGH80_09150 [Xanthomonadaceae bacterium]
MFHRNALSLPTLPLLALALAALTSASPALAQSTAASQVSAISVEPSAVTAAFAVESLQSGSQLVVTAIRPVGDAAELSVETAGHVSVTGLKISGDSVRIVGLVVGVTLSVTAVEAGWLINKGSEIVAFVPDQFACSLIHHREL